MSKTKKPLTPNEGAWFREQHAAVLQENRELRAMIVMFCDRIGADGLIGQLVAADLRSRLAKVPKR